MLIVSLSPSEKQLMETMLRVSVSRFFSAFLRPVALSLTTFLRVAILMQSPTCIRLQMCQRSSSSVGMTTMQPQLPFLKLLLSIFIDGVQVLQVLQDRVWIEQCCNVLVCHYYKIHNRMLIRFIAVALLVLLSLQSPSITTNESRISKNATYSVTLDATLSQIPSGGYVLFQLPSQYYPNNSTNGVTCSSATCQQQGTTRLIVKSLTIVSGQVSFTIINIQNPPISGLPVFQYSFYDSSGTMTDPLVKYLTGVEITAGTLLGCSISFTPNVVSTLGTMNVTVNPSNNVLAGGKIVVNLPLFWSNSGGTAPLPSTSIICSPISNLDSGLGCNANSNTINIFNSFNQSNNNTFSFSVQSVFSTPVSDSSTEISLTTQSSTSRIIDTGICTIIAPNPVVTTYTTSSSPTVGISFTLKTNATLSMKVLQNDIINLVIPLNLTVNSVSLSIYLNSIACGIFSSLPITFLSQSTNSTSKTISYTISSNLISNCTSASMQISGPNLTSTSTSSKTISYFLSRTNKIYATGSLSLIANPNAINPSTVTLTSNVSTINQKVKFSLSFITVSALNSGSVIIGIPSNLNPTGIICSNTAVSGTPFSPSCSYTGGNLIITNLPSVSPGANISFSFEGCSNPSSTQPVSFSIQTVAGDTGVVDALSSFMYTATADTIITAGVTSNSYTNGESATYTVSYIVKNQLTANSKVLIGLPLGMTFNNTNPSVTYQVNGGSSISSSSNKVASVGPIYNDGVVIQLGNSVVIAAGTNLSFAISSINNPITTQPSKSFYILSSDSSNYSIQSIASGVTITMINPSPFSSATVSSGSFVNGAMANYTITIIPLTRQPSGSILVLTFPTSITVASDTKCYNGTTPLSCSFASSLLSITLANQLSAASTYTFVLTRITNPRTKTPSGAFTVATQISSYKVSSSSATGVTNTQPNLINSLSMTVTNPSQSFMGSSQTLRFILSTTNYLTDTDYILITFPSQYSYIGPLSCLPYNCESGSSNLNVKVKSGVQTFSNISSFNITLSLFQSPIIQTSDNFLVSTYQSNDSQIDIINSALPTAQASFYLSCTLPCQTCSTNNASQCLTCYSSSINPNSFYYNNSCYLTCPNITYTSGSTCIPCVFPCKTCTSVSACTSCIAPLYFYYPSNNSCLTECPAKFFAEALTSQCKSCSNLCQNCSGFSTNCTTCNPPFLLQNNQCVSFCTGNYFNLSNVCTPCDVSCNRCAQSSTNCTNCATGYSRSGTICVSTCPVSQLSINGVCVNCSSSCFQCTGSPSNCTSCQGGKFLYNGQCLSTCPSGTIAINGVCQNSSAAQSISSSKLIPFPYMISCAIICVLCLLSKFSSSLTSIPAMGLSLNSIIQILASVTILILAGLSFTGHTFFETYSLKSIGLLFIVIGMIMDIVLNISTIIYFCKSIQTDGGYMRWKKRTSNTLVSRLCLGLSGVIYKFIYFQFSKAFGSLHLQAALQTPVKFYPITIMTLVGVFPSIIVITGCGLIALDPGTILLSAEYIQAIDCLIVKIVGAIMALASLKKSDDFFDEQTKRNGAQDLNNDTIEGLNDLNDSYMMEHSVSYVGSKPLYQNDAGEQGLASKLKLKNSKFRTNASNPIRQQEEYDDADQGLDKKNPGTVHDKNYYKVLDTQKDHLVKNQNHPGDNAENGGSENALFYPDEDQWEQNAGEGKKGTNKEGPNTKSESNNNQQNKVDNQNNKTKLSPNTKSENRSKSNKQSPNGNKAKGKCPDGNKVKGTNKQQVQRNQSPMNNKNGKNKEDANVFQNQADKQQISDDEVGKKMDKNSKIRMDQGFEEDNIMALDEDINISKIQKKKITKKDKVSNHNSRNSKSPVNGKSSNDLKNLSSVSHALNKQKQAFQAKTPINRLNQLGPETQDVTANNKRSSENQSSDKNKSPYSMLNRMQEVESKQIGEKNDSLVNFEKDPQLVGEEDNSLPQKTNLKSNKLSSQKTNPTTNNKKGLASKQNNVLAQNNELDDQLNNLDDNSGLIDSSAYGTQMIEKLVKGLSGRANKVDQKKIFNQNSELESVHEGDIFFNQVSPSEFNIQNQRFDDSMFELEKHQNQTSREFPYQSFRRVNFTQGLFTGSHSDTSIGLQNNLSQIKAGLLKPEERHNVPSGIIKTYESFDLAPIHERGKSMKITGGHHHHSLTRQQRYQTTNPDDINKRNSRLKSLQKIYLQRLDVKGTQPIHKRSTKFN